MKVKKFLKDLTVVKWGEFKQHWNEFGAYWLICGFQVGLAVGVVVCITIIGISGACE